VDGDRKAYELPDQDDQIAAGKAVSDRKSHQPVNSQQPSTGPGLAGHRSKCFTLPKEK